MKFQNPSLNFFLTEGRTHTHTHTQTSRKQYAPHFFKVRGIKMCKGFFTKILKSIQYGDHFTINCNQA